MSEVQRVNGIGTDVDTDYYLNDAIRYCYILFPSFDLTTDVGIPNGASELLIKEIQPLAYRIKPQGGATYVYLIIDGVFADKDSLLEKVHSMGTSVGPNGYDFTTAQVPLKYLD